jgi:hypothetical protein
MSEEISKPKETEPTLTAEEIEAKHKEEVEARKIQYTEDKKAAYIAEQTALDPNFKFDLTKWNDRPVWSDTIPKKAPMGVEAQPDHRWLQPGSAVPYFLGGAILVMLVIVAYGMGLF